MLHKRSHKYLNDYSLNLISEVFHLLQNHYNLGNFNAFVPDNPRSKYLLNSSVYRVNPPKLRAAHHCSTFKIKSNFGAVTDVNVRFAQNILPIMVIFSLFFPKSTQTKITPLEPTNGLNALFRLKQCTCRLVFL